MKLLEVFDRPYQFDDVTPNGKDTNYTFSTEDGTVYDIGFKIVGKARMFGGPEIASVAFGVVDGKTGLSYINMKPKGKEDPFRVLGTVVAAMKDYLNKHPLVDIYHFSIDKNVDKRGSLERVYNRMMDKLVPPTWDIEFKPTGDSQVANYLIKIK